MSEQFKAGDEVELKSGGPKMTVTKTGNLSLGGPFTVWCEWHDGKKKVSETLHSYLSEIVRGHQIENPPQHPTRELNI